MSARHKLNSAYINAALVVAGLAGIAANSWMIFTLAAAGLIAKGVLGDEIRMNSRPRRRR
jgi:uncharacterized membrane protein